MEAVRAARTRPDARRRARHRAPIAPPAKHTGATAFSATCRLTEADLHPAWMDPPARYKTGWTCVPAGGSVDIPIAVPGGSASLSGDEDFIKATLWWYDRRVDDGGPRDLIDMWLHERQPGGVWATVASSTAPDNRQRIHFEQPGPYEFRLRLQGTLITSPSGEGCGPFSHKAYFALLAEDNDREFAERPLMSGTVRPE